ncbi:MAG: hypothetical protein AB1500_01655 [Bacillota bacterium]
MEKKRLLIWTIPEFAFADRISFLSVENIRLNADALHRGPVKSSGWFALDVRSGAGNNPKEESFMYADKALLIIRALANGVDPTTGTEFPPDSPCHDPQVIRALYAAVSALEKENGRVDGQREVPKNVGKPWTPEEDGKLADLFDSGKSIKELADIHERTKGAIKSRLIKLGKVLTKA